MSKNLRWLRAALVAMAMMTFACEGPEGPKGDDGVDGEDGMSGADGADGQDGSAGSDGEDGQDGADGSDGLDATDVVFLASEEVDELILTVDSISMGPPQQIEFTLTDGVGRGAVGLRAAGASGRNFRVAIAQLVPGTNGDPSTWDNYMNRDRDGFVQGTYESSDSGTFVDNGDGTYSYTLDTDITNVTVANGAAKDVPYDASLVHRMTLQVGGRVNDIRLPSLNIVRDFVPTDPNMAVDPADSRYIAATSKCNECHGDLRIHGSRYEVNYCVVCHNVNTESSADATVGHPAADMSQMTHAIHSAHVRADRGLPPFELGGEDYSEVGYPQDLRHCTKCHEASPETPQGDNWQDVPNRNSCAGCHNLANASLDHSAIMNDQCASCHADATSPFPDAVITTAHLTENPTTNNPDVPAGYDNFVYDIDYLQVNGDNTASIRFRILREDPVAGTSESIDFLNPPADLSRGPSFLLSYAVPQDGVDTPIDYNNVGQTAAQPASASVTGLAEGTEGSMVADVDGYFIATTDFTFPANSMLRAVTLQGYYSQDVGGESIARHAISDVGAADGDTARREIVDSAKCADCHEWFEAHGGNRVYEVQGCAACHVPNLTSSGRTTDPTTLDAATIAAAEATLSAGVDPNMPWTITGPVDGANPLTWPESTQNLKDLVHGIHGSDARSTDYQFVRLFRGSPRFYNFSHVTYPNDPANCEACHISGTASTNLPEDELASTYITIGTDPGDRNALITARDTVPNDNDIVTSPGTAACATCHDGFQAVNHMILNGGTFEITRAEYVTQGNLETCNVCHGTGRAEDAAVAHGG